MATITGDYVGYPGFQDLGDFSPRRKIFGSKNLHVFRCQIFTVEPQYRSLSLIVSHHFFHIFLLSLFIEGATEKVPQFVKLLNSIYNI
jgi:hypothetical protein